MAKLSLVCLLVCLISALVIGELAIKILKVLDVKMWQKINKL
jgi:hypothetical protein